MRSFLENVGLTRIQLHARTGLALFLSAMLPIGKADYGHGSSWVVIYTSADPVFMIPFIAPAVLSGAMLLTRRPILRSIISMATIPFLIADYFLVDFMSHSVKSDHVVRAFGYYICNFLIFSLGLLCVLQLVDLFRSIYSEKRAA